MTDIVAFLTARLDEDQAAAEAANTADPTPWTADTDRERDTPERTGHGFGLVIAADSIALWDCEGSSTLCMTAPTAEHVARHDPARVLAEVAAKRKLLVSCAAAVTGPDVLLRPGQATFLAVQAMHTMAAAYADHPDYDERWRP